MKDEELRKLIGSRIKQRRLELNIIQQYIAEKMGVNKSTIQRYEAGTIDNSKKLILEGLAEALHVSVEWLKGETDEYESDITNKKDLQIRDIMTDILNTFPLDMTDRESDFSCCLMNIQHLRLLVKNSPVEPEMKTLQKLSALSQQMNLMKYFF